MGEEHAAAGKPKPLMLIIEVVHSYGKKDNIKIHEGDDPVELAQAFVQQHGLTDDYVDMLSQSIQGSIDEHNRSRQRAAAEAAREEEGSNYFTTPEQSEGEDGMVEIEEGDEEEHEEGEYDEDERRQRQQQWQEEDDEGEVHNSAVTSSASKKHNELLERMQGLRDKMKSNGGGNGGDGERDSRPTQAEQPDGYAAETPAKQSSGGGVAGPSGGAPTPAKDAPEVAAHEFTSKSGGLPTPWEQQGGIAPPPKYYHVSNPVSRGAASTRSPQRMEPPTHPDYVPDYSKPSTADGGTGGEDMYNRLKQAWSSNRSNDGSVSVKDFQEVSPPAPTFGGAGRKKGKGGRSRKTKAASRDDDPKRMETFHRLYDDHARMEKTRKKQREKKMQSEAKYMEKKSFKVTGKSSEMLGRNTAAPVDVGDRLHKHAVQKKDNEHKLTMRKQELEKQKETWSCPRCHFENAFNSTSCRRITGRTVPHDQEHPTAWIHAPIDKVLNSNTSPDEVVVYCGQPRPEADFVPTNLSEHSRNLIKGWRRTETVWDTLHSNAAAEEKRRNLVHAHMEDHAAELTLQPHIPASSRALVTERRILDEKGDGDGLHPDKNVALFQMAKEKQAERDEKHRTQHDHLSFAPNIGKSKLREMGDENQKTFVQRLSQEHVEREERLRALRDKHVSDHDPHTGMEYFKPLTGRGPLAGREHGHRAHGDTVHEALHNHHEHVEGKVRHMQEFSQVEVEAKANRSHVTAKSAKLNSKMRNSTYADVYRTLLASVQFVRAGEAGGELPSDYMDDDKWMDVPLDTSKADPHMLAKPKMQKMTDRILSQVGGRPITWDMFCVLMDEALNADSLPSGNHHAPTKRTDHEGIKAKENAELTFKPKLSKNSKRLAQSIGRNGSRPIHEVLNDEQRRYNINRDERVKAKHADEVQDCTFKPKIKKKKDGGAPHYVLTRKVFHEQGEDGIDRGSSVSGSGRGVGVDVDADASISLSTASRPTVDLDSQLRMKQRRDRNMTSPGGAHIDSHHRWGETLRSDRSGMDRGNINDTMRSATVKGGGGDGGGGGGQSSVNPFRSRDDSDGGVVMGSQEEDDMVEQYELESDSTAAERAGRREGTNAVVRLAEELINEGSA